MKMHVLPRAADPLPDAGFLHPAGLRCAARVERLRQPDIAKDGCRVSHEAHVRLSHRYLLGRLLWRTGQIEVVLVKRHPDGQLPAGLRLKTSDRRIAQLGVGLPVAGDDRFEEFLVEVEKLLFNFGGHFGVFPA